MALYWRIGHRIRTEVLKEKRADYGKAILSTLSKELVAESGNGFSVPNLSRMTQFKGGSGQNNDVCYGDKERSRSKRRKLVTIW